MELKKYALSDVCTIVPGFAFKSNDFGSGENIAVKIKDIEPPSVNIKNAERVCFTPQDKFRLSEGDYIMAMTGATIGKVGKLQIDAKNVYINQRVCKFNPITSVCDKEYLYYVLSTSSFRNFIYNNVDSKLAQPNIGHRTIYKYTHLFPSNIKEQKLIASVLNNIDRKIGLNKQINDNLEAMAKQLYDYWFVQFDFPNDEGKPYKSSGGAMVWNDKLKREIPQGWSTLPISAILDKYPTTKRYETKEYLSQGKYPIIDQGDTYIVGYTNEDDNLLTRHPAVLFGDHSTKVKFLDFDFARGADGTQILYSSNDAVSQYYLYLAVSTLQIPNPGYSRHFKYLKELPIVIPSLSIAIKFANIAKPLFKKWTNNIFNNIALTKQRDELLPLLMNGQASVNSD